MTIITSMIPDRSLELKPCPHCETSEYLKDCYVVIRCTKCLMEGPATNNGNNDDHADWLDHENAIKMWNKLPRKRRKK